MATTEIATSRAEAKSSGAAHYATGKPCASGHVAARWTGNGECMACAEARRSDPETRAKANIRSREVYVERREQRLESQSKARKQDPERFRSSQAEYCRRHPEKRRESQNQYYARNRGRYIGYSRARELGVKKATPSWANREAIEAVYRMAKRLEKAIGGVYHVDHHIPLKGVNSEGVHVVCGLHVHTNLVPIPAAGNRMKTNKFEVYQC